MNHILVHLLGRFVDPYLRGLEEKSGAADAPKPVNDAALVELIASIVSLLAWPALGYFMKDEVDLGRFFIGLACVGELLALIGLIAACKLQGGSRWARWACIGAGFLRIFGPVPLFGAVLGLPTIYWLLLNREARAYYRELAGEAKIREPRASRPFAMPERD